MVKALFRVSDCQFFLHPHIAKGKKLSKFSSDSYKGTNQL